MNKSATRAYAVTNLLGIGPLVVCLLADLILKGPMTNTFVEIGDSNPIDLWRASASPSEAGASHYIMWGQCDCNGGLPEMQIPNMLYTTVAT
jgi:hypothetical protein